MNKIIVISLGGSLISKNEGIDVQFLIRFHSFIVKRIARGERFILVCGGGVTCRNYQTALSNIKKTTASELDTMGIAATYINAELMRLIFKDTAESFVNNNPNAKYKFTKKVMTACGDKPGHSSDHYAVNLAINYGAKMVVNLTNVEKVYSQDPAKNKHAQAFDALSWDKYLKIIGTKWSPGANYPFDPVASQYAKKHNLKVVIADGSDLGNFTKILDGKEFTGTVLG